MGSEPLLAHAPVAEEAPEARPPATGRWRRFRRHRLAMGGLTAFALLILVSFLGPELWRYDVDELTDVSSGAPSLAHPFGTDELGHDWLALVLNGSRRSIQIALMVAFISTAVGTCWGAVAGLYGRRVDAVMMRVADLALMLPLVVVGAVLAGSGGGSWWMLGLILGLLLSPIVSRVVRAQVLSLRDREFVEAARVLGATRTRIIVHHLLPNVAGTVIVAATLAVAVGVLAETSLSFLGFGVRPPDTSLGLLVSDAAVAVNTRPWLFYFPGLFIIAIALSVNFVGDGLRDAFDPRQDARRAASEPGHGDGEAPAPGPASTADPETLLAVEDLSVRLRGEAGTVHAVRGASWSVSEGEVLAIVGESGSGKSATALAVMGLLPRSAKVRGSIRLRGQELLGASDRALSDVRGNRVALVPQDPQTALNPVHRIGDQIAEVLLAHTAISREEAHAKAVALLADVGIPEPELRARQYPRQLSGGMRQRVAIAAAMANDPDVIVADEPTTALDVTVQAQILDALMAARARTGAALVIITHDLGVVAGIADRVLIMYAGKVVESAAVADLFAAPRMPYTLGLLGSLPRLDGAHGRRRLTPIPGGQPSPTAPVAGCAFAPRCPLARNVCRLVEPPLAGEPHLAACHFADEVAGAAPEAVFGVADAPAPEPARVPAGGDPVLEVRGLVKTFPARRGLLAPAGSRAIHAVRGVSFQLRRGETLGIAGESGCGKSTLARLILGLEAPTAGTVLVHGRDVTRLSERRRRAQRPELQVVFQDPYASLDPRATVAASIAEPLRIHGRTAAASRARVAELLDLVGLTGAAGGRYPHELSGGQRQRVAIARALALDPDVLLLDEPTSALDASIQAGVLNLLEDVQRELGLAYVFISHDLAVLRHVCDRVAVMYLGQLVETAPADVLFEAPLHPYTQALLTAAPIPDPAVQRLRSGRAIEGDPPNPASPPDGCAFRGRCLRYASELDEPARIRCREQAPPPVEPGAEHPVSCHHPAPLPPL